MIPLSVCVSLALIAFFLGACVALCLKPRRQPRPSSDAYFLPRANVVPYGRWDADELREALRQAAARRQ